MARPRQMTDEELLAHARQVFLEHGPSASTTLVAKACGVSQAALFKRFGDKQTLLLEALRPPARPPFLELVEAGPADGPLHPQLVAIGEAILGYLRQIVPCMTTLSAAGVSPDKLLEQYDPPPPVLVIASLTRWFHEASDRLRPIPPQHLAMQFLGGLHVRAFMQHLGRNHGMDRILGEPKPYIEDMVDVFLTGVEQ